MKEYNDSLGWAPFMKTATEPGVQIGNLLRHADGFKGLLQWNNLRYEEAMPTEAHRARVRVSSNSLKPAQLPLMDGPVAVGQPRDIPIPHQQLDCSISNANPDARVVLLDLLIRWTDSAHSRQVRYLKTIKLDPLSNLTLNIYVTADTKSAECVLEGLRIQPAIN